MRDYGKVSPQFWIGKTGKLLRGDVQAQLLALYLMTSPHANMIGVFHCPIAYMAHETGLPLEGASKALQSLIDSDFCTYDAENEYVFVHEFAAHQVGESLAASDNRCKGVRNELSKVPKGQCWQGFIDRYRSEFHLDDSAPDARGYEAPSKPLRSQKQKQEQKDIYVASETLPTDEPAAQPAGGGLPAVDTSLIVDLYHEVLPELPRARLMTDSRRRALTKRWRWLFTSRRDDGSMRATTRQEALDWFREFFDRVRDSDWLMGRGARAKGHESWQCDLDFLLSDRGLLAVVEKTAVTA